VARVQLRFFFWCQNAPASLGADLSFPATEQIRFTGFEEGVFNGGFDHEVFGVGGSLVAHGDSITPEIVTGKNQETSRHHIAQNASGVCDVCRMMPTRKQGEHWSEISR
jgi:hypothetical protein